MLFILYKGTPSYPGRTVTLLRTDQFTKITSSEEGGTSLTEDITTEDLLSIEKLNALSSSGGVCWGKAFRLNKKDALSVVKELDIREKAGYVREIVSVLVTIDNNRKLIKALTYIAKVDETNVHFLGPADTILNEARHIVHAKGPSGSNLEYFNNLCVCLEKEEKAILSRNDINSELVSSDERFLLFDVYLKELQKKVLEALIEVREKNKGIPIAYLIISSYLLLSFIFSYHFHVLSLIFSFPITYHLFLSSPISTKPFIQ